MARIRYTKDRVMQLDAGIEIETPAEGVTAAEYKLKDLDGNRLDISDMHGLWNDPPLYCPSRFAGRISQAGK